jgi:GxxExxY protein
VDDKLTGEIIGAAIEVHRWLGPGLLESAYEQALCHELVSRNVRFKRQVALPLDYKGVRLDCDYRLDLVVDNAVIIELKAVEKILPVHEAQILSYLRLSGLCLGLLINFHVHVLKDGIRRFAL